MAKHRGKYALFLPKLSDHTSSFLRSEKAKNRLLTCGHNDMRCVSLRPVSLHPISEVRKSVASCMQRVSSGIQFAIGPRAKSENNLDVRDVDE